MKKRSSLNTRMREFVPLVASRIMPPVKSPCTQHENQPKQLRPTPGEAERHAHLACSGRGGAYDDERGDGLVHPSLPFQQVAGDNAGAEQRDEDVDGDDGVVVRDREPAGFAPVQAHVGRHLGRSAATSVCNSNVSTRGGRGW
jgi:hypothetical protein